jgi:hypothetical protein
LQKSPEVEQSNVQINKQFFSTKKNSEIIKKSSYIHRLFRDSAGVILLAVSVSSAEPIGKTIIDSECAQAMQAGGL